MSRTRILRSVAGAAVTALCAWGGAPAHGAVTAPQAAALGVQAHVYGLPLMESLRVRSTMTSVGCATDEGNAPVNTFSNARGFSGPENRTVIAPNVDTLYSIAHLDLGAGPVILSHPEMGSRYFVFQLVDPYTNVVGYVGSRTTGSSAGRFAITWSGAPGTPPPGTTPITVAHRRIWVIGRTLASDAADQLAARALMQQFTLVAPPGTTPPARECDLPMPQPTQAPRLTGLAFLDGLSAALEENPPPARDAAFLARLAPIGVGPGRRTSSAGLSRPARAALARAVTSTDRAMTSLTDLVQTGRALTQRGWTTTPANLGDYGTDYITRAGVAQIGLGANTPEEAIYRVALFDSRGSRLDGRRSYRLRFAPGQEPPADAFWSITAYDDDGFLVDAPEGRYAVGDSHPPLLRRPDGSVEIVFSRTRPADPLVNWLPVPPARFRPYLRIYAPRTAAFTGAWRPPPIERLTG